MKPIIFLTNLQSVNRRMCTAGQTFLTCPTIALPCLANHSVFNDFVNACFTVENSENTVITDGKHTVLDSSVTDFCHRCVGVNKFTDGVVNYHKFNDSFSSFVTGIVAFFAAFAVAEFVTGDFFAGELESFEVFIGRLVFDFAVGADAADETLTQNTGFLRHYIKKRVSKPESGIVTAVG